LFGLIIVLWAIINTDKYSVSYGPTLTLHKQPDSLSEVQKRRRRRINFI